MVEKGEFLRGGQFGNDINLRYRALSFCNQRFLLSGIGVSMQIKRSETVNTISIGLNPNALLEGCSAFPSFFGPDTRKRPRTAGLGKIPKSCCLTLPLNSHLLAGTLGGWGTLKSLSQ
jgi:hypothetical protein